MWHIILLLYARTILYIIIIIMCGTSGTRPLFEDGRPQIERAAFLFVHTRARNAHFEEGKTPIEREREREG